MKKATILLSMLLTNLTGPTHAYVTYIGLWQDKKNPQKNIILLGDRHNEMPQVDITQITLVHEFLARSYQLTQPIDVFIELSKEQIERDIMPLPSTYAHSFEAHIKDYFGIPYLVHNMLISTAYFLFNKRYYNAVRISAYPCDIIKNNFDRGLSSHIMKLYSRHTWYPGDCFNTDKMMCASTKNYRYTFAQENDIALWKNKNVGWWDNKRLVLVQDYKDRLTTLNTIVQQTLTASTLSEQIRSDLYQHYIYAHTHALEIINTYCQSPSDHMIQLLIAIYDDESLATTNRGTAYDRILDVIDCARNITMLTLLMQSQYTIPYTIMYTGMTHTMWLESYLPILGYTLIHEIPVVHTITCTENEFNGRILDEHSLRKELEFLRQKIAH